MVVREPSAPESAPDALASSGEWIRHLLSLPFVYAMAPPLILLDISISLYQAICFRLWRIPRVRRGDYVGLARGELIYLTSRQRLHCAYCSYANGVIAYAGEAASLTEQYWCPIKHRNRPGAPHVRYDGFLPYGDPADVQARMEGLRRAIQSPLAGARRKRGGKL